MVNNFAPFDQAGAGSGNMGRFRSILKPVQPGPPKVLVFFV
jgi:hypothetical protein